MPFVYTVVSAVMGETDDFEWDDDKDAANRAKRGLPLLFAALMFDGREKTEDLSDKSPEDEARFETVAPAAGRVLFCVWHWRNGRRRIISLRVANRSERRAYQEAIGRGGSSRKGI